MTSVMNIKRFVSKCVAYCIAIYSSHIQVLLGARFVRHQAHQERGGRDEMPKRERRVFFGGVGTAITVPPGGCTERDLHGNMHAGAMETCNTIV
jgi:hypothetical protein